MKLTYLYLLVITLAVSTVITKRLPIEKIFKRELNHHLKTDLKPIYEDILENKINLKKIFFDIIEENVEDYTCELCLKLSDKFQQYFVEARKPLVEILDALCIGGVITQLVPSVLPEVCYGMVDDTNKILWSSIAHRFDNGDICGDLDICESDKIILTIQDYQNDVLSDKPHDNAWPTPTMKNTYKILQLTDLHPDFDYQEGYNANCGTFVCCRPESGKAPNPESSAGYWGTSADDCDIPPYTVNATMAYIAQTFKDEIEYILWTGDTVAHDDWAQSEKTDTFAVQQVYDMIHQNLPDVPIHFSIGNHEALTVNQFDFIGNYSQWTYDNYAPILKEQFDEKTYKFFKENMFYAKTIKEKNLVIVSLNSNADNAMDFALIQNPTDPKGQLAWLRSVLSDAEKDGLDVFIIGHIPGNELQEWEKRYEILVDRYQKTIKGQFYGHTHKDHLKLIKEAESNATAGIVWIAPSLTTQGNPLPSFRIYEIDSDTNMVVNWEQYRLNLTKWNKESRDHLEYDLAYTMKEEYDLADLQRETIADFVEQLRTDKDKFNKFYTNYNTGTETPYSEQLQKSQYCENAEFAAFDNFDCNGYNKSQLFNRTYYPGHDFFNALIGPWYTRSESEDYELPELEDLLG